MALMGIDDVATMQIRWLAQDGQIPLGDIAKAFGVTPDWVLDILEGRWQVTTVDEEHRDPLDASAVKLLRLMEEPPRPVQLEGTMRASWPWFDGAIIPAFCRGMTMFGDVTPPDLSYDIDMTVGRLSTDAQDHLLQIQRLKRVSLERVRGLIHQRYAALPGLYEFGIATIQEDLTLPYRTFVGYANKQWRAIALKHWHPPAVMGDIEQSRSHFGTGESDNDALWELVPHFKVLAGLQFSAYYEWRAYLQLAEGHMSVGMFTSPGALRDLFALRDIPPGRRRRSALLHWVIGHRRRKSNGDDAAWVRKHLRGATEFSWGDLRGKIYPSPETLKQLAKEKAAVKR